LDSFYRKSKIPATALSDALCQAVSLANSPITTNLPSESDKALKVVDVDIIVYKVCTFLW
jgi:hypothetical protein